MKKFVYASVILLILSSMPIAHARVDAEFIIKDAHGREIYMITPENKMIFGNVLVNEEVIFDASASNSMYKIDKYYWDFDGDGKYDRITKSPITIYKYKKPGLYNATLLAVASGAPPHGDGDAVTHEIKVVKHFTPPIPSFTITLKNDSYFIFNASDSYDKESYIKGYYWDFNGDGKWDYRSISPIAHWKYKRNGYFTVVLKVIDYDLQINETKRVIEINWLNGSMEEIKGRIKIENKCSQKINASIVINNYKKFNISIEKGKEKIINTSLSPSLNEIYICQGHKKAIFLFYGYHTPTIIIEDKKIYIGEKPTSSTPGYQLFSLIASTLILFMIKRKRKRY